TEGANRKRMQIAESRLLGCDWRKDMAGGSEALPSFLAVPQRKPVWRPSSFAPLRARTAAT
ncbi:MAG: hypothetical protein ACC628_26830, partial [Pirellulaceae bacterium]